MMHILRLFEYVLKLKVLHCTHGTKIELNSPRSFINDIQQQISTLIS